MIYTEVYGDLFEMPKDYILAHCISSDFAMGAGIARIFRNKYGVKQQLKQAHPTGSWFEKGYCIITDPTPQCPWTVANLVTKQNYFQQ